MGIDRCKIVCSRDGGPNTITFGQVYEAVFANMLEDRSKCTQYFIINDKNEGEIVSGFNFLYYTESRSFDSAIKWFSDSDIDKVLFVPGKIRIYKEKVKEDSIFNLNYMVSCETGGTKKFEDIDDIELKLSLLKEDWMICRLNPLSHA